MERLYYQDLYKGYELNDSVCIWSLSDHDIRILDAAVDLVENNYTLRELAVNSMIPRSTLCDYFKFSLRQLSYELYTSVRKVLIKNKQKYFRGYLC